MCLASFLEIQAQVKKKKNTSFSDAARKISKSVTTASSNKQEENKSNVTGEAKKHTSSPDMLADALAVSDTTSRDKQENKDKLTEEDKKKLNAFLAQPQHINLV